MARCKNVTHDEREDRLCQAVYSPCLKKKKKKTTCEMCGMSVRSSNMARHKRTQHAEGNRFPRGPSPGPRVSPLHVNLKVRLPAVTKALDRTTTVEATVEEARERALPPTPGTEEEFIRGLAKLYSARVPQASASTINYRLTKEITAVAGSPGQRCELKQIMETAGLVLYSKEEWEEEARAAEARGVVQALKTRPSTAEAQTQVDDLEESPELCKGSVMFAPVVMASASAYCGPWGFKVVPCRLN